MMKAVLAQAAVLVAAFAVGAEARWTGNVYVLNLMSNRTLDFINCTAFGKQGDASSTIVYKPKKEERTSSQEVARFYLDTGGIDWDFEGFCWWNIPGVFDKECVKSKLPGPVTTCPWVGWNRVFSPITGTESISWNFETPGHYGIGDVTIGKRVGHASKVYCVCEPGVNCQQECAQIN